ncbi:hypothetical protein [Hymenobacter ginkgonis]|uniref:hypothetical protein n=1 Tax=Hymenobacter ginkgonis TaxID=2682976 RepID=UPI00293BB56B|nr:hypothetical protein [Hymenobacter ginkgonis]
MGGIYLYPPTVAKPTSKLRLPYECYPPHLPHRASWRGRRDRDRQRPRCAPNH